MGGVWLDIDRHYLNTHGGPGGLCEDRSEARLPEALGEQALDYVRYRHTDSDLYRVARQQQFVKAFKGQVQQSFSPLALPKVVDAITHNVEAAQGGGSDVSGKTVLSYALFAYGLPHGHVFQSKIEASRATRTSRPRPRTSRGPSPSSCTRMWLVEGGHAGRARREGEARRARTA